MPTNMDTFYKTIIGYNTQHPRVRVWQSLGLIIVIGLIIIAWPGPLQAAPPAQTLDRPPSVLHGRTAWTETCLPWHSSTGQGDGPTTQASAPPLPDFTAPKTARQMVPLESFEIIKNGRLDKPMPPWNNRFNDVQIWDKVAYVWSLSPTLQDLNAGQVIYLEHCTSCHGNIGAGDGFEAPAQIGDFTDLKVMVQRSQLNLYDNFYAGDSHNHLNTISETELWQTLAYIRTFSFVIPEPNGVLQGQVINATTNQPVGNLEVRLLVIQKNSQETVLTFETMADESGHYTFKNLPIAEAHFYKIEADYQNITYPSDELGVLSANSTETTVNLNVYEVTSDDTAIFISQLHYILSFTPQGINVLQVLMINNDSNQTYVGPNGETFSFTLPAAVENVVLQNDPDQTRFIEINNRYFDTEPYISGKKDISIVASYNLPYGSDDKLTIELPLPAKVINADILLNNPDVNLSSDQFEFTETRDFQGRAFSMFNGTGFKKGETISLKLNGFADLDFSDLANQAGIIDNQPDQNILKWVIIGLGGLMILVVGGIYPLTRSSSSSQSAKNQIDSNNHRHRLLVLLAHLDEVYETGVLEETTYHQARAKYKAKLIEQLSQNQNWKKYF